MTHPLEEPALPALFSHVVRKEWGVGIPSGEDEGRRRYLFADGSERTLAHGFHEMMREVEQPDQEQQATYARLRAILAARQGGKDATGAKVSGPTFREQHAKFRHAFPGGLLDERWTSGVRGGRDTLIERTQADLGATVLDQLLREERHEHAWNSICAIINETDAVPQEARVPATVSGTAGKALLRSLVFAVRELLHGSGQEEQRFDRYLAAYAATFLAPASWEAATLLRACVDPKRHIVVAPTTFRKQLKTLSARGSLGADPNSADYARLLGVARVVANRLAEHGEMPRDLFDVYDFMRVTFAPAKRRSGAARRRSSPAETSLAELTAAEESPRDHSK